VNDERATIPQAPLRAGRRVSALHPAPTCAPRAHLTPHELGSFPATEAGTEVGGIMGTGTYYGGFTREAQQHVRYWGQLVRHEGVQDQRGKISWKKELTNAIMVYSCHYLAYLRSF
jgi:hypothetical protein